MRSESGMMSRRRRVIAQALEAVVPFYLAPLGPRERYPKFRWRARR